MMKPLHTGAKPGCSRSTIAKNLNTSFVHMKNGWMDGAKLKPLQTQHSTISKAVFDNKVGCI